ncbi:MAG: hypothetical protein JXP39_04630 [Spirochaetales bacterium]|nr:hypothetical protein [Spirochaetales bacterium]
MSIMNETDSLPTPRLSLSAALRAGLSSARENALPGLVLWLVAMAVVLGYYFFSPVTDALETLGALKARGGFLYSAIATAIFGGLIPFFWRSAMNRKSGQSSWPVRPWQAGLFLAAFWAWKGVEVDLFYRFQDILFGAGAEASKIIPKVLMDQFVYNPVWAAWTQILAYWWLENSFRPASLADRALWSSIGPRVLSILISTWGVWIPMVSIIYAMPSNLQIPLFNIALCFWSLMLSSLTKEKKR